MRCDVASNGVHEIRATSPSTLIPNADFVRCDISPDGVWVITYDWQGVTSCIVSVDPNEHILLGSRNANNPHGVRFCADGTFHILNVFTPDNVNRLCREFRLASDGRTWLSDRTFDANYMGSQGILDITLAGDVIAWADANMVTLDGIVVRSPMTRNGRTACVLQEGYLGVSVYDAGGKQWYRVYQQDTQLNPRIAENGTVAVSAEPGGFFEPLTWTKFNPHGDPAPIPTPEDNMIAYGPLMTDWLLGETSQHADGPPFLKITKPNGKVVCVTPEGHVEERENAGAWERFEKRGNALVAQRDLHGNQVVYLFPLA